MNKQQINKVNGFEKSRESTLGGAFTLVELIVVITILAILGTIAFISLQGYSRDSRDSVRISDISNIRTSLELFHLNAGKYPLPDDSETITYSGGILWYQGTVGDQVVSNLSRNMSEVPTDPLTDKQYFYSVHNNKNENQVLALLEGDVSALNYGTDIANAASLAVTPRLDGNYNGLFVKNSSSIVPIPSIMTAEDTTGGLVLSSSNIGSMITHLGDNIPSVGNVISNTGALTGLNFSPYDGTITSDSTDSDKVALMDAIVTAYSGSSLENNGIIKDALSKSGTGELTAFVDTTVLNNGSSTTTSSSSSTSSSGGSTPSGNDSNTVLLLSSDFDSSESAHNGTFNGNMSTITGKFGNGYDFDGTGDFIEIPDSEDFNFGSGDFTIDFWMKAPDSTGDLAIMSQRHGASSQRSWSLWHTGATGLMNFAYTSVGTGTDGYITATTPIDDNQWHHIAVVRNGTTITLYIDGVNEASASWAGTFHNSTLAARFGADYDGNMYTGTFDEIRITKGEARWSGDFSSNLPGEYTSDANTKLLLHAKGSTAAGASHNLTFNGDMLADSANGKFAGAYNFDGSNDYLTISDSTDFDLGTGAFTIDFWYNVNSSISDGIPHRIVSIGSQASSQYFTFGLGKNTGGCVGLNGCIVVTKNDGSWSDYGSNELGIIPTGEWHHYAIVRDGSNNLAFYMDGIQVGTDTFNYDINSNTDIIIGRNNHSSPGEYANGKIDELRISKGVARWSDTFSVPTAVY